MHRLMHKEQQSNKITHSGWEREKQWNIQWSLLIKSIYVHSVLALLTTFHNPCCCGLKALNFFSNSTVLFLYKSSFAIVRDSIREINEVNPCFHLDSTHQSTQWKVSHILYKCTCFFLAVMNIFFCATVYRKGHIHSKFTKDGEETTHDLFLHAVANSIVIYITENQIFNFTFIKSNKTQVPLEISLKRDEKEQITFFPLAHSWNTTATLSAACKIYVTPSMWLFIHSYLFQ